MKIETFYKKYANVPLAKRILPFTNTNSGVACVYTLVDMYKWIDEQNTKRRESEVELKRLLDIAEKMLH